MEGTAEQDLPVGQQRRQIFRYAGIPTLQYGPANLEGVHAYNETVDVQDVVNAAKVYIGAITDYLGQE